MRGEHRGGRRSIRWQTAAGGAPDVQVARARSRLLARIQGSRAAVLAKGGGTYPLGQQSRTSLGAKRVAFAVPLSALARRALHRRGRLAITLRVMVTPATGKAYTTSHRVRLRFP